MAFSATVLKQSVHGDERVTHYLITADAASGSVATGHGSLFCIASAVKSMSTVAAGLKTHMNALGGGTATAGYVGFDGCTSGDDIYLTVWGR
jgi:hypothetical protein